MQKTSTVIFYSGIGFMGIFLLAQSVWSWSQISIFNILAKGGGTADPAVLSRMVNIEISAAYTTKITAGIGMSCLACALILLIKQSLSTR